MSHSLFEQNNYPYNDHSKLTGCDSLWNTRGAACLTWGTKKCYVTS